MKIRLSFAFAALSACAIVASSARAQDAADLKKDMVGQWELSTTDRSKTCVVTLKPDSTPQGLKLELEPGCAAALPFTKEITGWNVKGLDIVRLQDATGEAVVDFTQVEAGILEGTRSGVRERRWKAATRRDSQSTLPTSIARVRQRLSTSIRTMVRSSRSAREIGATRKPRCGSATTRPSEVRRDRASRMAPRLTSCC